jgi:hypothetical protein
MTATSTSAATTDVRRIAAERMAEAAGAWAASLDTAQRAKGVHAFESGERERWFYTPTVQSGLSLLDMNPKQQRLAHMLIASGLSQGGYVTAMTIMGLENPLHLEERWRDAPFAGERADTRIRDPLMYYVAVYGDPGSARWSWHAGGHHVSIGYTIVDGVLVSPTPTFFGSHPAEVAGVGPNLVRPLAGEEDLARELLHLFDAGKRSRAIISPAAPFDIIQSNRPRVEDGAMTLGLGQIWSFNQDEAMQNAGRRAQERHEAPHKPEDFEALRYHAGRPAGVPARDMSAPERDALLTLIRQYVHRLPDDVAAYEWGQIESRGIDGIHFAWAGSPEPRQPHYYRLQGPRFLVEYDNVQNNTNHIHSVWRDPQGDHGQDVLAKHYAASH